MKKLSLGKKYAPKGKHLNCISAQNCLVDGKNGDGTTRGTCPELQLCQNDGTCMEHCTVMGSPGTGNERGSCQMHQVCTASGACLPGMLFNIWMLKHWFCQFMK